MARLVLKFQPLNPAHPPRVNESVVGGVDSPMSHPMKGTAMTLRYRMMVAHILLSNWERNADSAFDAAVGVEAGTVSETTYQTWIQSVDIHWSMLIEWLDRADLRGSSFDPTCDLYLSATV
jgi:hypothetical protein